MIFIYMLQKLFVYYLEKCWLSYIKTEDIWLNVYTIDKSKSVDGWSITTEMNIFISQIKLY